MKVVELVESFLEFLIPNIVTIELLTIVVRIESIIKCFGIILFLYNISFFLMSIHNIPFHHGFLGEQGIRTSMYGLLDFLNNILLMCFQNSKEIKQCIVVHLLMAFGHCCDELPLFAKRV